MWLPELSLPSLSTHRVPGTTRTVGNIVKAVVTHVGYVQYKQYGFFAGEILLTPLSRFLRQIVFYEDKRGMNTKLHPSTTHLYTELSENIPVVRGRSASMTLLD